MNRDTCIECGRQLGTSGICFCKEDQPKIIYREQIIHCNQQFCEWQANGYCLNNDLHIDDERRCGSFKVIEK